MKESKKIFFVNFIQKKEWHKAVLIIKSAEA